MSDQTEISPEARECAERLSNLTGINWQPIFEPEIQQAINKAKEPLVERDVMLTNIETLVGYSKFRSDVQDAYQIVYETKEDLTRLRSENAELRKDNTALKSQVEASLPRIENLKEKLASINAVVDWAEKNVDCLNKVGDDHQYAWEIIYRDGQKGHGTSLISTIDSAMKG